MSESCPECQLLYSERTPPEQPPCETCRAELLEENEDIANVYMVTRRQYIIAEMGRVVDINIPAVKDVMDLYQVKNQRECLMMVRRLFHHFLPRSPIDEV